MPVSCDLFCRVVDNLGDAGVCWRLARQLTVEHDWAVRMWIDDPAPLAGLRPGIDPIRAVQIVDGVEIHRWPTADFPDVVPGDVIIEAFACDLPSSFVTAMAARDRQPVWINLEYLSAEDWVRGCHGLSSPHPALPLTKYFFFPGFSADTGGLIRERDLPAPMPRAADQELVVSMFCYQNPALPKLLDLWAKGSESIVCHVAEGFPRQQVEQWAQSGFPVGSTIDRGALKLVAAPFVSQPAYDSRLADCDLNFVRGEDSFVRAQWAERAFVWQIYPQVEDSHFEKLDAFIHLFGQELPGEATREAMADFWRAWNGRGDLASTWPAYRGVLPRLTFHARQWSGKLAQHGDLAGNLVRFCVERI
jgi:uncharacterized repeat protein (TIGR03837 family)